MHGKINIIVIRPLRNRIMFVSNILFLRIYVFPDKTDTLYIY